MSQLRLHLDLDLSPFGLCIAYLLILVLMPTIVHLVKVLRGCAVFHHLHLDVILFQAGSASFYLYENNRIE